MLYIDKEVLDRAKNDYYSYAEQMGELRNNLAGAINEIRAGWQSDAGKAFFEKFDNEWEKNLNYYIQVIEHMSKNMEIAENKYQTVFDEANKLGL